MTQPAVRADQRIDLRLVPVRPHVQPGRRAARAGRLGYIPGALGRLLAAELESGEKGVPLGIHTGRIAFPLRIKSIELRAIFGRGGIGPGDAVIIQGQVDPVGHDGHRTYDFRAFGCPWQPQWVR